MSNVRCLVLPLFGVSGVFVKQSSFERRAIRRSPSLVSPRARAVRTELFVRGTRERSGKPHGRLRACRLAQLRVASSLAPALPFEQAAPNQPVERTFQRLLRTL